MTQVRDVGTSDAFAAVRAGRNIFYAPIRTPQVHELRTSALRAPYERFTNTGRRSYARRTNLRYKGVPTNAVRGPQEQLEAYLRSP